MRGDGMQTPTAGGSNEFSAVGTLTHPHVFMGLKNLRARAKSQYSYRNACQDLDETQGKSDSVGSAS